MSKKRNALKRLRDLKGKGKDFEEICTQNSYRDLESDLGMVMWLRDRTHGQQAQPWGQSQAHKN